MLTPPSARGQVFDGKSYDALNLLGAPPGAALSSVSAPGMSKLGTGLIAGSDSPLDRNSGKPWHPDNPLFWFGMLGAVTFGLIGASTAVRIGPFKGALAAGKT